MTADRASWPSTRDPRGILVRLVAGLGAVQLVSWLVPWNALATDGWQLRLVWFFGGQGLAVWWAIWPRPRAFALLVVSALYVLSASVVIALLGLAWLSSMPRVLFDRWLALGIAWEAGVLYALGAVWRGHAWGRWTLLVTSGAELLVVLLAVVRLASSTAGQDGVDVVMSAVVFLHGLRALGAMIVLNRPPIRGTFASDAPQTA